MKPTELESMAIVSSYLVLIRGVRILGAFIRSFLLTLTCIVVIFLRSCSLLFPAPCLILSLAPLTFSTKLTVSNWPKLFILLFPKPDYKLRLRIAPDYWESLSNPFLLICLDPRLKWSIVLSSWSYFFLTEIWMLCMGDLWPDKFILWSFLRLSVGRGIEFFGYTLFRAFLKIFWFWTGCKSSFILTFSRLAIFCLLDVFLCVLFPSFRN